MKKSLLFLFSNLAVAALLSAQSLTLENMNPSIFGAPEDFEMSVQTNVKNTSSVTKRVLVKSQVISKPENTTNYFCWELCYGPSVVVSPTFLTLEPGQSVNNFHGYYRPQGVAGIATVRYTFYDQDQPNDSVQFIGQFNASAAGISSLNSSSVNVSVYPNPASDIAFVRYSLNKAPTNAAVEVYNMLGSKVLTYPVTSSEGIISIPVEQLQAGLYFYSFKENGKLIRSGRITIKH